MKKEKKNKKEYNLVPYFLIIVFVVLIRTFIVTPVKVNGTSMDTTLHNSDIMLLNKTCYKFRKIKRFDIVVVDKGGSLLIKRVIGLPGESLKYVDDVLYINNKIVKEHFKNQPTNNFNIEELGYDKIPKDCYIVLGDNRSVSLDSRVFGCVHKDQIKGSANMVIFPFKDFGYKK